MLRTTLVIMAIALLVPAASADAQGRNNGRGKRQDIARAQGIPPGHLPPAGLCRVWYDNLPNGRQPAPTSCGEAERIASRTRNARVIYGDDRYGTYGTSRNGRDVLSYPDPRYPDSDRGRAVPRVPGRNRDPRQSRDPYSRNLNVAFDNGYRDGLEKGQEDLRDGDRYDPARHSRYRSADRGYRDEYGTKAQYKITYREGFEAGYDVAYRQRARRYSNPSFRLY